MTNHASVIKIRIKWHIATLFFGKYSIFFDCTYVVIKNEHQRATLPLSNIAIEEEEEEVITTPEGYVIRNKANITG
ncbi:hypothetical protein T07_13652 [Trichinella nelsoni]|uniref:Uncharacterized protein n=1 Tax=Trichinella nelsoni TaxID=6336 RepID=A0A0V0RZI9_9BILA|nr:hypothetical protein T07_13652 [Trichinella nelsoni]